MTCTEVRQLRQSLGLTQQAFADTVGVHRNTVLRWETAGSPHPIPRSMQQLLGFLVLKGTSASTHRGGRS